MATKKNFNEVKVGEIFTCLEWGSDRNRLSFVKIKRSNGKYAAIRLDDYLKISPTSPTFQNGLYTMITDCTHWRCEVGTPSHFVEEPKETKEPETKLIGLYNADDNETTIFKVTAEQLKAIYYMYNNGWLMADNIIENPEVEITDLTK